ncbi:DnaD domain-containing protein [Cytobacillus praedii]|uniref:DnaD domain protein n=1 Tax=Cytobacillus praedii TaxID=1742358 RepID=A0A4R1AX37_9BACI|nr:DnaD domain protein [Cytobacillus praedii]TCJ04879.1 DnaD domain protein [Cytobacillus praedii]
MAKYRQVHVEFWQDGFVLDLTPEEKYFYIYLMTNSKTSQCGIYELPKRIIETETGYNRETVEKLLKRFIDYGKILYCDKSKEIMIINWIKYNGIRSPKVIACIKKELEAIKNKDFVKSLASLCQQYGYPIDTLSIDYGEEEEKEEEKEEEREHAADAANFYQENFGVISPYIADSIQKWEEDLSSEIVIEAMMRTLAQNKRAWGYTESILRSWASINLNTLDQILAYELQRTKANQANQNSKDKSSSGRAIPDNFDFNLEAGED